MYNSDYLRSCGKGTTFTFANEALKELWEEELTGQISDGMWENTRNSCYEFWCNVKTEVGNETKLVGFIPSIVKRNFAFSKLIQYVGDRMLEIVQKHYPQADEKDLKSCLKEISNAMKAA